MIKSSFFLFCFLPLLAFAGMSNEAALARDQVMQALKNFNPATALADFNANPKESALTPNENADNLRQKAHEALPLNLSAKDVYTQSQTRPRINNNPNSPEMRYAESILQNPDEVLTGKCYKEPEVCEQKIETKTCDESLSYERRSCSKELKVEVNTNTQSLDRFLHVDVRTGISSFNLFNCLKDNWCDPKSSLFTLIQPCEDLNLSVNLIGGKYADLTIIKQPTCDDASVIVQAKEIFSFFTYYSIVLTQRHSQESWQDKDCQPLIHAQGQGSCFLEASDICLEPNAIKLINGKSIQRPCWGYASQYQCQSAWQNNCASLLEQGCSQSASLCLEEKYQRCQHYLQTFQCSHTFCIPERTICPDVIPCSSGDCDIIEEEVSDDINEGLSRLGALAGAASEVAEKQIGSGVAAIFGGQAQECKKHPLGLKDCCTGSGWGDWIVHCPQELQNLQKAKTENRVVYLGSYKNHKLGSHHHSYCVFPSKLSAIIQIEGRYQQLGIGFGGAEEPKCRGISPEELERIDFTKLNLKPLEEELLAKKNFPQADISAAKNQAKVENWYTEGRAHD